MKKTTRISLIHGDITKIKVDAIVNVGNNCLSDGGGVNGAIHQAGGATILNECQQIIKWIHECPTGNVAITTAGKLPAKKVIHAVVAPIWRGGMNQEAELLANCYRNSLKMVVKHQLKIISFPNIGTGIYGFPKEQASEIAIQTVKNMLEELPEIQNVIFVVFDDKNLSTVFSQKSYLKFA